MSDDCFDSVERLAENQRPCLFGCVEGVLSSLHLSRMWASMDAEDEAGTLPDANFSEFNFEELRLVRGLMGGCVMAEDDDVDNG